jgi:hypothetical protein
MMTRGDGQGTRSRMVVWKALVLLVSWLALCPARAAEPAEAAGTVSEPAVAATAVEPAAALAAAPAPGERVVDRLKLETTAITGNRELPKVMSIVPWKPAEPPAGPERPMGSLIEELLAPLDRDEFRREITYYRDLTKQSTADGVAAGVPAASVERVQPESRPSGPPGATIP